MITRTRRVRPAATADEPVAETPTASTSIRRRGVARPAKPAEQPLEPKPEIIAKTGHTYPAVEGSGRDQDEIVRRYREKVNSPKTAIRAMCVQCMGGYIAEIRRCVDRECALWAFREGKNPFHALAKGNREQAAEEEQ